MYENSVHFGMSLVGASFPLQCEAHCEGRALARVGFYCWRGARPENLSRLGKRSAKNLFSKASRIVSHVLKSVSSSAACTFESPREDRRCV